MIYLCGKPLDVTIFPDKTSQVWQIPQHFTRHLDSVSVKWKFENEGEFIHLAQLKMLLNSFGVRPTLYLPSLPYGRQDKGVSNSTTFALHAFAALINSLKFEQIVITDPHSELAIELIKNSVAVYPIEQLKEVISVTQSNAICFPDKGARVKYGPIYTGLGPPWVYGEKVRDQLTGKITSYEVKTGKFHHANKNVLIVDDICDGGATFVILAKELLKTGALEVNLFVTNGIFSKGLKPLFGAGIKRIFTQEGEADFGNFGTIIYRRL